MPWQITDRLWVSGHPKAKDLEQSGATVVVTMCKKKFETPEDLFSWYLPVQDGKKLQVPMYKYARDVVLTEHRGGGTVLVHCLQGRNRSMLVAGLACRHITGESSAEIYARIMEMRPSAFHNELQREWFLSLDNES